MIHSILYNGSFGWAESWDALCILKAVQEEGLHQAFNVLETIQVSSMVLDSKDPANCREGLETLWTSKQMGLSRKGESTPNQRRLRLPPQVYPSIVVRV